MKIIAPDNVTVPAHLVAQVEKLSILSGWDRATCEKVVPEKPSRYAGNPVGQSRLIGTFEQDGSTYKVSLFPSRPY